MTVILKDNGEFTVDKTKTKVHPESSNKESIKTGDNCKQALAKVKQEIDLEELIFEELLDDCIFKQLIKEEQNMGENLHHGRYNSY